MGGRASRTVQKKERLIVMNRTEMEKTIREGCQSIAPYLNATPGITTFSPRLRQGFAPHQEEQPTRAPESVVIVMPLQILGHIMPRNQPVDIEHVREQRRATPHPMASLPKVHRARIIVDLGRDLAKMLIPRERMQNRSVLL